MNNVVHIYSNIRLVAGVGVASSILNMFLYSIQNYTIVYSNIILNALYLESSWIEMERMPSLTVLSI